MHEGPFVEDKKHGDWVYHESNGTVEKGPYVEDKKHGHFFKRYASGGGREGPYVEGKQHGRWFTRHGNGYKDEGKYVDGRRERIGHEWTYKRGDNKRKCWWISYSQGSANGEPKKAKKKMCR